MPVASESSGGWLWALLGLLVVCAAGGYLYIASRRRATSKAQVEALVQETRTGAELQLPPVLAHQDAGVRAVAWPPVRARLIELRTRWQSLADGTSDEAAGSRQGPVAELLGNLVVAVDAETEALNQGRDWSLLRPRVDELRASLIGQLLLVQPGAPAQPGGQMGSPGNPSPGPTL